MIPKNGKFLAKTGGLESLTVLKMNSNFVVYKRVIISNP